MKNSSERDAKKASDMEKASVALELRKKGCTYESIAQQLGLLDKSYAHRLVKRAIAEIVREPAQELLQMELGRLDALMMAHWERAKEDPKAAQLVLHILDRRARYMGLDAPQRVETEVNIVTEQEDVLSKLARIAASVGAGGDHQKPEPH